MTTVVQTLESMGIYGVLQGDEYVAPCIAHKERTGKPDSDPSWSFNVRKRLFQCFSCGWRGNLSQLMLYAGGAEAPDLQYDNHEIRYLLDQVVEKRYVRTLRLGHLPESSLAVFDSPPPGPLADRRISAEAAADCEVLWDPRSHCWVFPVRNRDGNLLGWQVKGHRDRTFRNYPRGIRKADSLFGYRLLAPDPMYALVVESPLDVAVLWDDGVPAVATYGAAVSPRQLEMLRDIPTVVAAFDNDAAGRRATDMLGSSGINLFVVSYPDGCKDPGDIPDSPGKVLLSSRAHYLSSKVRHVLR